MPRSNLSSIYVCQHIPEAGEVMSTSHNILFLIACLNEPLVYCQNICQRKLKSSKQWNTSVVHNRSLYISWPISTSEFKQLRQETGYLKQTHPRAERSKAAACIAMCPRLGRGQNRNRWDNKIKRWMVASAVGYHFCENAPEPSEVAIHLVGGIDR